MTKNLYAIAFEEKSSAKRLVLLKEAIEKIEILKNKNEAELTWDETSILNDTQINKEIFELHSYTPIMQAIELSDNNALRLLIKAKGDVNYTNSNDLSPIAIASRNNTPECLKTLLEEKADVNKKDRQAYTPLHLAISYNQPNNVRMLIDYKANIEAVNTYNGETPLFLAISPNKKEILGILIDAKANLEAVGTYSGRTPLFDAVSYPEVLEILIKAKANIDATSQDKTTPIMLASLGGHVDSLTQLIKEGANINSTDAEGRTPLSIAILAHYQAGYNDPALMKCEQLLMEAKADITPSLSIAIMLKDKLEVTNLINKGANIYARRCNSSTLIEASMIGDIDIVKILLKKQAADKKLASEYLDLKDEDGLSAIMCAAAKNEIEILKNLIKANASVNNLNNANSSPAMIAAEEGNSEALKLLIHAKANLQLKDDKNLNALEYAKSNGDNECIKIIAKALQTYESKKSNFLHKLFKPSQEESVKNTITVPASLKKN